MLTGEYAKFYGLTFQKMFWVVFYKKDLRFVEYIRIKKVLPLKESQIYDYI